MPLIKVVGLAAPSTWRLSAGNELSIGSYAPMAVVRWGMATKVESGHSFSTKGGRLKRHTTMSAAG